MHVKVSECCNPDFALVLDGDCCSASSPGDNRSRHLVAYDYNDVDLSKLVGSGECAGTLESLWVRAIEICDSNSLKNFLRKRGKLSSLWMKKGMYVLILLNGMLVYLEWLGLFEKLFGSICYISYIKHYPSALFWIVYFHLFVFLLCQIQFDLVSSVAVVQHWIVMHIIWPVGHN